LVGVDIWMGGHLPNHIKSRKTKNSLRQEINQSLESCLTTVTKDVNLDPRTYSSNDHGCDDFILRSALLTEDGSWKS
jgi:hypothetical protein